MVFSLVPVNEAVCAENNDNLNTHLQYLSETVQAPSIGTINGEWSVMALARGGYAVPKDYFTDYYNRVLTELIGCEGELHSAKYTEYSRVILGLSSVGYDPSDVGGYNLLDKLTDLNNVTKQGINGPIFALIALDSNNYEIPQNSAANVQVTRDNLIKAIIDKEISGGGFDLSGKVPDADMTAMALQALAPYQDREDVKPCVDRALSVLEKLQNTNGGFGSIEGTCSESNAQVIIALTALGIDPATDPRFVKENGNAISALMAFSEPDGGFKHQLNGEVNAMATDQCTLALVAYNRFQNKQNSLYQMTDVTPVMNPDKIMTVEQLEKEMDALLQEGISIDNKDQVNSLLNAISYMDEFEKKQEITEQLEKYKASIEEMEQQVQELNDAIWNELDPRNITLDDKDTVNRLIAMYEEISPENREYVKYYDDVLAAKKIINEQEAQLNNDNQKNSDPSTEEPDKLNNGKDSTKLPKTGGSDSLALLMVGAMMCFSGVIALKKKRPN
jgi:LPXTG-motif cell wall-anchored protein